MIKQSLSFVNCLIGPMLDPVFISIIIINGRSSEWMDGTLNTMDAIKFVALLLVIITLSLPLSVQHWLSLNVDLDLKVILTDNEEYIDDEKCIIENQVNEKLWEISRLYQHLQLVGNRYGIKEILNGPIISKSCLNRCYQRAFCLIWQWFIRIVCKIIEPAMKLIIDRDFIYYFILTFHANSQLANSHIFCFKFLYFFLTFFPFFLFVFCFIFIVFFLYINDICYDTKFVVCHGINILLDIQQTIDHKSMFYGYFFEPTIKNHFM